MELGDLLTGHLVERIFIILHSFLAYILKDISEWANRLYARGCHANYVPNQRQSKSLGRLERSKFQYLPQSFLAAVLHLTYNKLSTGYQAN